MNPFTGFIKKLPALNVPGKGILLVAIKGVFQYRQHQSLLTPHPGPATKSGIKLSRQKCIVFEQSKRAIGHWYGVPSNRNLSSHRGTARAVNTVAGGVV